MHNNYVKTKQRLYAIILATTFVFLLLILRLGYIQLIWGNDLQAKAVDQWTRDIPLVAKRGLIVDANGNTIVSSITSYSVYVRGRTVTDAKRVTKVLCDSLQLSYEKIFAKVSDKKTAEVTIARQVDAKRMQDIKNFNLDGVYFAEDSSREYIYGDLLTQVLGNVSIDNIGLGGIESQYNKYLSGINGSIYTQTDLVGIETQDKPLMYVPSIDGLDIQLTIDVTIQRIVENTLNLIMQGHSPKGARAIVMDCTNGEILAMSSKPSFDLNNPPNASDEIFMEYSRNTLVTDVYEPGSTFKVLTAAATLQEYENKNSKAFGSSYVYRNNNDFRIIDSSKINCWTKHTNGKHSNQTLGDALNNSCNPIFTDIGMALGKNTMYNYISKFGYGQKSGIDFVGEQAGLVIDKSMVTNGDLARICFGQTIAVTPMQLLNATVSAVNGGLLYQPRLVKSIQSNGKVVQTYPSTILSKPVTKSVSKELSAMLENVVKLGSGKQAYIDGYQVGGKTGTAQKYLNGSIAEGKYISSFVGFFPASAPKYATLIIVDEPKGAHYGSTVAAPYAKLIFQQIINYKDIKAIK